MSESSKRVALKGSNRVPIKGATVAGEINPKERVEVTVVLRPSPDLTKQIEEIYKVPITKRRYLTHTEFEKKYGASQQELEKIRTFARENGLEVKEINKAGRSVRLAGTAKSMSSAFGVDLHRYEYPEGSYRGREGEIFIPKQLEDTVLAVQGLDNRPVAKPHFLRLGDSMKEENTELAAGVSYFPTDLTGIYNINLNGNVVNDGSGQSIGIIELVGDPSTNPQAQLAGYTLHDIQSYFAKLNLPPPHLKDVSVDGAQNSPNGTGPRGNADDEVELDIEVAGAIAAGANIVVYFAPNTDDGFRDAVNVAINGDADGQNKLPIGSVLSISWGRAEKRHTPLSMRSMDTVLQTAQAKGITICVATGDAGSGDGVEDGGVHADFPASSPNVLACGGTSLPRATVNSEVVWNNGNGHATGGGISEFFDIHGTSPFESHATYQTNANIPPSPNTGFRGRGIPDVSGNADSNTGYNILIHGRLVPIGGTSAVAPLYAGLIALINKSLGTGVGFLNPTIYGSAAIQQAFNDITSGNNDTVGDGTTFPASRGWDACTGWGSPDWAALLSALRST